jgi:two-component system response regulator RegA
MVMRQRVVLIVDDDAAFCRGLESSFRRAGWRAVTALTAKGGVAIAREERPNLIVLDKLLPDGDGFEVIEDVRAFDRDVKIVVCSGYLDTRFTAMAMNLGATACANKPADATAIFGALGETNDCLKRRRNWERARSREEVELRFIDETIEQEGSISAAAELMDVNRRTLQRRRKQLRELVDPASCNTDEA